MRQRVPDIGLVVLRNGRESWVAQVRIDHGKPSDKGYWFEQSILIWGATKERFVWGDKWESIST